MIMTQNEGLWYLEQLTDRQLAVVEQCLKYGLEEDIFYGSDICCARQLIKEIDSSRRL